MSQFAFSQLPTLVHHLHSCARTVPERQIFRFIDEEDANLTLNYARLDLGARRLAVWLGARAARGGRVILMHAPGSEYVQALLGCLYAGLVAVPAYPPRMNRSLDRLRAIVTDAQACLALTTQAALQRLRPKIEADAVLSGLAWAATDALPDDVSARDWCQPDVHEDTLALLQYTSGSTSTPKGVMITHAQLRNNVLAMAQALSATGDDRMVTWLPPYHDMGLVGGVLSPLFVGMETVVLTPGAFLQRPLRWLSAIAQHRATISGAPDFAYALCARRVSDEHCAQLDLSTWRVAFCGAERVRADTLRRFVRRFSASGFRAEALAPCYGLAEATLAVSFSRGGLRCVEGAGRRVTGFADDGVDADRGVALQVSVSCGEAVPGAEVVVADAETLRRLPDGEVGEFWVKGNAIAQGYWNKPQLSAETFRATLADEAGDTWLRTGDLGFLDNGQLHVLGRLKDLIIIRGVNVYPEDVESFVERVHDCLRPAGGVAFGIEHDGEEKLVVVQEINPGKQDVVLDDVARAVFQGVAETLQLAVHRVVLVAPGAIPRTSSGKVQRSRCRELYLAGELDVIHDSGVRAAAVAAAPPELVERVARLMAEVLGVQTLMPDDDFFWLGGHSLLATQLVSRVRTACAVELPLGQVFEAATPRRLAARIAALPVSAARPDIGRVDRTGRLPMTFSQERMWLLHQMDPVGTAYNVAGAVLVSGPLDVPLLARAFSQVEEAHEVLRTRYSTVNGEAEVRIAGPVGTAVEFVDLSGQSQAMDLALQHATQLARKPFDISTDSLLRIRLFRLGATEHVLAVCLHHLVTDAWSMGILARDVLACYDSLVAGASGALPPPAIGYVDYARWQRDFMAGPRIESQREYWHHRLRGAEAIELPADWPRRQRRSSAGEVEPVILSDELMGAIETLARAHGATPFMVMLAAFDVLLYRWTGRTDLVVGVPVANRNWQESEALMGTLVNTLALRVQFAEDASFASLLSEVRGRALEAFENQDLPFEKLISDLPLERKAGSSPLVSVMFDYQNAPLAGRSAGGVSMRPLLVSRGSAQFDLSLMILDTDLGRVAGVEYSTDLFAASTIRRMLGHYLVLLETVVLDSSIPVDRLPLLRAEERRDILAWSQRTCRGGVEDRSLVDVIEEQCIRSAARIAVLDGDTALTYAQLRERVQRLARQLVSMGVAPGKRVAVCVDRGVDLVVALLAVLRSGAAYVPLDPSHPEHRLGYILQDARPELILTQERLVRMREFSGAARVVFLEELARAAVPPPVEVPADLPGDESHAAYVIYTSGSTGRPKGVEVSRRALANFIRSMRQAPGIDPADRLLSVTTVAFDIAGLELYLPLAAGARVYVADSQVAVDGQQLMRLMSRWRATFMQATPATWKTLIESGWTGDRNLKVLCGGEAFPRELAGQLLERAGSVWNMYGPTETTIWSTLQHVTRSDDTPIPIGAPIAQTAVYILDRHRQPVPQGVPGEIWIGGLGVADGYFQRPELTAERFVPDPFMPDDLFPRARMYRTGDAGRVRADGALEHLGRLDEQIKIRGFRIEPGEIEHVLKEQPHIRDAVVVAREVSPGDMRLVAYFVPEGPGAAGESTAGNLLEALRRRLPAYMIPSAFVPLDVLPTTPNNKIDRRALPAPTVESMGGSGDYVPQGDELEAALVEIWQELLAIPRVGIRDSFFLLGGHSLLAVRLFARIEKRFGAKLPLAILFERPTIEFLAEAIREAGSVEVPARPAPATVPGGPEAHVAPRFIVPIHRGGRQPPFFCVHGAGGTVLNLWSLSRHLGADQPFYGIQAQGVDGVTGPMAGVRDMAMAYLQELRREQPVGPYHLGGYCAGGWVALEMARLLRASGERVALLALIDCYHPRTLPEVAPLRNFLLGAQLYGWTFLWTRAPSRLMWYLREAYARMRITMYRTIRLAVPLVLRDFWLTGAMMRLAPRYRPAAYDGDAILFRAREFEPLLRNVGPRLGWDDVLTGDVTVVDVTGDHRTLMDEPNAREIAVRLQDLIAR